MPVVCFLDVNGREEGPRSRSGAERLTRRMRREACCMMFLLETNLALPATFKGRDGASKGDESTWISRSSRAHRIDYVAVPEKWRTAVVDAYADKGIALSTMGAEDHRAAVFAVRVSGARRNRPRPGRPERKALRTMAAAEVIAAKWAETRQMPVAWDVERVRKALAQEVYLEACPKVAPAPRQARVGEETWLALRRHAAARRAYFHTKRQEKDMRRRHACSVWKGSDEAPRAMLLRRGRPGERHTPMRHRRRLSGVGCGGHRAPHGEEVTRRQELLVGGEGGCSPRRGHGGRHQAPMGHGSACCRPAGEERPDASCRHPQE